MDHDYLAELKIQFYKGFGSEDNIVKFAVPNGTIGSGITYIIGPNNTGKSSCLNALRVAFYEEKPLYKYECSNKKEFFIELVSQNKLTHRCLAHQKINRTIFLNPIKNFSIVSQRLRYSDSSTKYSDSGHFGSKIEQQQYMREKLYNHDIISSDSNFSTVFKSILFDEYKMNKFNKLLEKLVPDFTEWKVELEDLNSDETIYYIGKGGFEHRLNSLGIGYRNIFRLCWYLSDVDKDYSLPEGPPIIIIDEPEISLHPQLQKKLFNLIKEKSRYCQIIIATHSTYFFDWVTIENGAVLNRLYKDEDGYCKVSILEQENLSNILNLNNKDILKGYFLDEVAKEVLFSKNIVFTEGLDDVTLLKRFIAEELIDTNFEFFGYGSGGAGNIEHFLDFAKQAELKAAAIFDGDQIDKCKECQTKFPEFKILSISEKDIRDKSDGRNEGLFDTTGKIKPGKRQKLIDLIAELNQYFGGDGQIRTAE